MAVSKYIRVTSRTALNKRTGKLRKGCHRATDRKRGMSAYRCLKSSAAVSSAGGARAVKSSSRRKTRRKSGGVGSTFTAKKSYALTGLGKLRKGCRKIKKNGRTMYRCTKPGTKKRKRR